MEKEYILAVETGGTKIQLALGDAQGRIVMQLRRGVRPELGGQDILEQVLAALPELNAAAAVRGGSIRKIGVGFGGPVDYPTGTVLGSMQVEGWRGFPLRQYLEEKTGLPVAVYNDTDAAAWGEYCLGAGRGQRTFFYTNVGSGIGGGLILDGELYLGQGSGAMEFGQTYAPVPWREGKPRRLEEVCSGWSIQKRLQTEVLPADSLLWKLCCGKQERITGVEFHEAINRGDAYSLEALDEVATVFSAALANVINLIGPGVIAVGGGISLIGPPLLERLQRYTAQYVYRYGNIHCEIRQAQMGEAVVPVGVLLLTGRIK